MRIRAKVFDDAIRSAPTPIALKTSPKGHFEAPEARHIAQRGEELHNNLAKIHGLDAPSRSYNEILSPRAHRTLEPMIGVYGSGLAAAKAMHDTASNVGWLDTLKPLPKTRANAYRVAADLTHLLNKDLISSREYWTGTMMLALWCDSFGKPQPPEAAISTTGWQNTYVPGFIDWEGSKTYDANTTLADTGFVPALYATHMRDLEVKGSERFAYAIAFHEHCAVPSFGFQQFGKNSVLDFIKVGGKPGVLLPSATLTDSLHVYRYNSVKMQPRVGADSVATLQKMVLAGERPVGLSVPTPPGKLEPTEADGSATGRAGFTLHDIEHAWVLTGIPASLRQQSIALHRHLKPFAATRKGHSDALARLVGPLVRGNLFKFTDLATSRAGLSEAEHMAYYLLSYTGVPLSMLLQDDGAYNGRNIQHNLLRHLKDDTFYATYKDAPESRLRTHFATFAVATGRSPKYQENARYSRKLIPIEKRWQTYSNRIMKAGVAWLLEHYPKDELFTDDLEEALKSSKEASPKIEFWERLVENCRNYEQKKERLIPTMRFGFCVITQVAPADVSGPTLVYRRSRELLTAAILPDAKKGQNGRAEALGFLENWHNDSDARRGVLSKI